MFCIRRPLSTCRQVWQNCDSPLKRNLYIALAEIEIITRKEYMVGSSTTYAKGVYYLHAPLSRTNILNNISLQMHYEHLL